RLRRGDELPAGSKTRTRASVLLENAFGQQVRDRFAAPRLVETEHMIEAAVLADDRNDMLDRRAGCARARGAVIGLRGCPDRRQCDERRGRQQRPRWSGRQHGLLLTVLAVLRWDDAPQPV